MTVFSLTISEYSLIIGEIVLSLVQSATFLLIHLKRADTDLCRKNERKKEVEIL